MTEYFVHEDFKGPWRRDPSYKVSSFCPYPPCTKPTLDINLEPVLAHANSLPSLSSLLQSPRLPTSKSFPHQSFSIHDLLDDDNSEDENLVPLPDLPSPYRITLKDLKFEKLIGTGMYSKVYLVHCMQTKEYYALKVIPKANIKKTRSETDIMRQVNCPFIVKLWNSFEDENNLYMLMEFAAGGELFYHLRERGKFEESAARFYASEVIIALEHLHSSGIIFRDLKLENLVLSATGHIKLTDFGFAKILGDGGRAFTLCGTPEYLAPEIIRGTGYSYSVDFWALGVLLFEMLSGFSPFFSSSPLEIYKNILGGKIKFPSGLSAVAKDLLRGLLVRDPRKRIGTVRNGVSELRYHPFFFGCNWGVSSFLFPSTSDVPPIVPVLCGKGDTTYFKLDDEEANEDGTGRVSENEMKEEISPSLTMSEFL